MKQSMFKPCKIFLSLVCTIITLNIIAQSNRKLTLSGFYSPDYSYRTLASSDSLSKIKQNVKNNYENAMYTYTAGLNICKKLFGPIAFETGASYSKKGYTFDSSSTSGNFNISQTYIYNYLQVPIKIKVFVRRKKYNFYGSAGVTGMMLFDAVKSSITTKNGTPTLSKENLKDQALNQFNYSMTFGVGLDYQLLKRLYLKIEPTYSKTLESIRNEKLGTFLYSTGVNVGLLVVVKK